MAETVLKVKGMTCNHCRMAVTRALEQAGYKECSIDLKTGQVRVVGNVADTNLLKKAIEGAGYQVIAG
ncbi:MAG: cation transporter [Bacillota bacterium]